MLALHNLVPAGKKKKRIGRGGSRGGTSGRGSKGQKARSGSHNVRAGFEGGQMPLYRRLPKRGFNNKFFAQETVTISLEFLDTKFVENQEITKALLESRGFIKKNMRVKVLGGYTPTKKLIVEADAFSKSAREAIEASSGQVRIA
ncbi:50S ribosomal protein L15 [candidate division TM6 bacterium RIFCSPHIGHO2_12_FULL_36_22]|nr:MAG: 50S ribosomal protein L15 [candidate division TM6 bacterium RIFCSPHIGHO2_12_FULL_36_22]